MTNQNQRLASELIKMADTDRAMRQKSLEFDEWDGSIDIANTKRMKVIIAKEGWPTISQVGKEAASAAWLLVQHADHDPDFQAHCLELMHELPAGECSQKDLAYLEDRVRVNTGRPQLYGTQFYSVGGDFMPRPIEDEANLEQRRSLAGMNSFSEYVQEIEEIYRQHNAVVAAKQQAKK